MSEIAPTPARNSATATTREARIRAILTEALVPTRLEIRNESHLHAGHFGHEHHDGGAGERTGETHFRVTLASPLFEGLSRLDRQRRVNALLAHEFANGLHALALTVI